MRHIKTPADLRQWRKEWNWRRAGYYQMQSDRLEWIGETVPAWRYDKAQEYWSAVQRLEWDKKFMEQRDELERKARTLDEIAPAEVGAVRALLRFRAAWPW